jgi:pimeloyl-ACP methyl ester carboxylesterase
MTSSIPASWRTGAVSTNGFRQFCREWEPRDETFPPVLALHGSLTQSGMWRSLAEAAGTVRMLCPDQRGFAQSEDPGSDACADFAADAVALAQARLDGRYVVMGHSFASAIALEAARQDEHRVAAVVLVDPVVRLGAPPAPTNSAPLPESFADAEEAARHVRATEEGAWPEEALARFVRDVMIQDTATGRWHFPYTAKRLARLRAFTASAASDYDLFPKAKWVRAPVLVFRGGASTRFPAVAEPPFLAAFPSMPKLSVCPTSGHFPTATEPGIVVAALRGFLVALR